MRKAIVFDMDGTITDLYGYKGWLDCIHKENASPYLMAKPLWDMQALVEILKELQKQEWKIQVVTWLAKDSKQCYKEETRQAKLEWLKEYDFPFDDFHAVQYGRTKADSVRNKIDFGILIDDNDKVRNGWNLGNTINPTVVNIIEELKKLLK